MAESTSSWAISPARHCIKSLKTSEPLNRCSMWTLSSLYVMMKKEGLSWSVARMVNNTMNEELIAPCGMNCSICSRYLAFRNDVRSKGIRMAYCRGCRPRDRQCAWLKRRCSLLVDGQVQYCYECDNFPCGNLLKLDKKYASNFRMSMIENLQSIKTNGITKLLEEQEKKWECPNCGGVICCHNGICFDCGLDGLRNKRNLYRWED